MPNPGLEEPIRKITLNLWDADIRFLKQTFGEGWSAVIRDWVRRGVRAKKMEQRDAK